MRENRGRQYISGLSKTFFAFFSEFVYGGLCFFQPKTFSIPRGIIPQNFSSLGFAVSQELGNKQTHRLTDSLTFYCFDRVILTFPFLTIFPQRNNIQRGHIKPVRASRNDPSFYFIHFREYSNFFCRRRHIITSIQDAYGVPKLRFYEFATTCIFFKFEI